MMLYTTLNKIESTYSKEKLLAYLNKTKPNDDPVSLKTILESNGISDAMSCLRGIDQHKKEIRLFALWRARLVEHLDKSGAAKNLNDANESHISGQITDDEMNAAWDEMCASRVAVWAAMNEAWSAAALCAVDGIKSSASTAARDSIRAARAAQEIEFIKRFCTEEN